MSSAVNINIENDVKDQKNNNVYLVVKLATAEKTRRQAIGDALVTLVAFPLLITCTVLLMSCMNTNWVRDGHTRGRVLVLTLTLLIVSLLVCVYTIQRLGICSWPSAEQRAMPEHKIHNRRRTLSGCLPSPLTTRDSELHLMVSGNLPPSYDSIISSNGHYLIPPQTPIYTVTSEKAITPRSYMTPHATAPPPPGSG